MGLSARVVLAGFVLAALAGPAAAFKAPSVAYARSGGQVAPGSMDGLGMGRNFVQGTGGAVSVAESVQALIGGNKVPLNVSSVLSFGNIAKAFGGAAAVVAAAEVGSALWDFAQKYRCAGGSGWHCDPGMSPELVDEYCAWSQMHGTSICAEDVGGIESEVLRKYNAQTDKYCVNSSDPIDPQTGQRPKHAFTYHSMGFTASDGRLGYQIVRPGGCNEPMRVMETTVPGKMANKRKRCGLLAGSSDQRGSVGADGQCNTVAPDKIKNYPELAKSPEAVASHIQAHPSAQTVPVAQGLMERGVDLGQPQEVRVSGPAAVPEPARTSTTSKPNPDGSTTTTTTTTQVTHNITYEGDTYNYTTTVTTNNSDGSSTRVSGPPASADEPPSDCEIRPDSVGCMKLGEVPQAEPVKRSSLPLEFAEDTVNLPSGCPPPIPLLNGQELSYQSYCDAAEKIRPVIIACAALGALLACAAALRGM